MKKQRELKPWDVRALRHFTARDPYGISFNSVMELAQLRGTAYCLALMLQHIKSKRRSVEREPGSDDL